MATALVINVPDARWLGPKVAHPTLAATSLANVGALMYGATAAADRMELGYLQLIPVTAQTMFDFAAVAGFYGHDLFINMDGVAASTATIPFVFATTSEFVNFDRNYVWCDAGQGPWIQAAGILKGLVVSNFEIFQEAGTWVTAIDLAGVGATSVRVGPGYISGTAAGVVTTLVTLANKTVDDSNGFITGVRCSTHGPAAGALGTLTTDIATLDISDSWLAVVLDAAQPTFTSGGAISWESGVPYTG